MRFSEYVWRHIPAGSHPFDLSYILKASGRWNRTGEYGCLYTAMDRETARAEHAKYLDRAGARGLTGRRDLVRLGVGVEPVLDLTDRGVRRRFGVTKSVLVGDDEESLETCRGIADRARSEGYAGILAPSAARGEGKVLALYPDASPGRLELDHGFERESLEV